MKSKITLVAFFIILISCSQFIKLTDSDYFEELNSESKDTSIIFSHNINGETHPCGCRNFPLGGLPQANGVIKSLSKISNIIYVDSGDTFFSNTIVPKMLIESSTYTAHKIAEGLDLLGLKLITPGDQDFALGENFLTEISNKHKFKFLITNSSSKMKIKHSRWAHIKANENNYIFLGILSPDLLNSQLKELVTEPLEALRKTLIEINEELKDIKNKKFILLSHSGIESDRMIAKKLPHFDWIIGAHSQSFLRFSEDVGKTQITQVLSRNHYLGEIKFPKNRKLETKYNIHETRDETKDLIKSNKMIKWLTDYKVELDKVLLLEQNSQTQADIHSKKSPTYLSCMECHTKQVEFWQETSHSVAFDTLVKASAANNSSCVGCHSLGFKAPEGFSHTQKVVSSQSEEKKFDAQTYWSEFNLKFKDKTPVKQLSKKQRKEKSDKWIALDAKHDVTHNFANVQCLHCHPQGNEHPFDNSMGSLRKNIQSTCLNCHTSDQSPEWYLKDSKGLATSVNKKYFSKKLKEVSCPKIER